MSDDGYELDPEEARFLYGENEQEQRKIRMRALTLVNLKKKCRTSVELRDQDDELINLEDILDEIATYVKTNISEDSAEDNQIKDQIMPLVSAATAYFISGILPNDLGEMLLSTQSSRYAILFSMCCAFLTLKVVQSKELKIFTVEEPMNDLEIAQMQKRSRLNEYVVAAHVMGISMKDLFEYLKENGKITDEDIAELTDGKNIDDN